MDPTTNLDWIMTVVVTLWSVILVPILKRRNQAEQAGRKLNQAREYLERANGVVARLLLGLDLPSQKMTPTFKQHLYDNAVITFRSQNRKASECVAGRVVAQALIGQLSTVSSTGASDGLAAAAESAFESMTHASTLWRGHDSQPKPQPNEPTDTPRKVRGRDTVE